MARKNILTRSLRKRADASLAQNDLQEAAALYAKICATDKRDADAWVMRGVVHLRLEEPDVAEQYCSKALSIDATHALAHHVLGSALEKRGLRDNAEAEYRKAISLRPDFSNAYLFLGNLLAAQERYKEAESAYHDALQVAPGQVAVMASLGTFYQNAGRYGDAEHWLRRALAVEPKNPDILLNLGLALASQGKDDEAAILLEKAVRQAPDSYQANYAFGNILTKSGFYDRALQCYRKATEINPGDAYAVGAQAHILERRGELDTALALLKPFVESGSTNEGIVLPFAELALQEGQVDEAVSLLEITLRNTQLEEQPRMELHFKLGKLNDKRGDYGQAFDHYREGNALAASAAAQAQGIDSIDQQAERILRRCESLGRDFWSRRPSGEGNGSVRPVFIVGMPRSGTTLLEQILASHPAVYGAGELQAVEEIARSLFPGDGYRSAYPAGLDRIDSGLLERAASRHLQQLDAMGGKAERVVDKCPHNFIHLGLIERLFPRAHVIHIVRDPVDTCLSIFFQVFTPLHAYACDLRKLGRYHVTYSRLMDYWKQVIDLPVLDIRYEQLVAEPEQVIRRLVEFCGLDWDDRCLSFHANRRDVNTPSYGQVRKPIYSASVARWKHYREYLEPLLAELESGQGVTG